ncbi:PDR/VanB family oxidoreductase [Mycobacteroides abscessus]|uniref:PDR/VanB family oxidoreductase n=1 Tax=Mycobacteroides abscessus TaxID=36809 RepID=UPI000D9BE725|nr:PDR/VanB family oxidoreductase [Mycobacteroides abscessus]SPX88023.1 putative oxidoreductase [Mycobacteroides abscessus]
MSTALGLKDVPADLYGKREHEWALSLMALAAPRLPWLAGLGRSPKPLKHTASKRQLVVRDVALVAVNDDVVSVHLAAPDNSSLPRWWPGAHLQVQLPSGLIRHYSLCGDPDDTRRYRIAVRRVPGGAGSNEIHAALRPGATLTVAGPRNAFPLVATNPPVPHQNSCESTRFRKLRFIAGGIGITPILPMLDYAERRTIGWSLIYAGRSRESMPFLNELARYGDRVSIHCDDVDGPPTPLQLAGQLEEIDALYCCGPPSLIHAMAAALTDYPAIEFHFERFGTPPIVDGRTFDVELARTGEILHVPPHLSVLDVVRVARPNIPYACKQGFCGTCRTRLLSGEPDHRDHRLTPSQRQNGDILICVSRADSGRLILDL